MNLIYTKLRLYKHEVISNPKACDKSLKPWPTHSQTIVDTIWILVTPFFPGLCFLFQTPGSGVKMKMKIINY